MRREGIDLVLSDYLNHDQENIRKIFKKVDIHMEEVETWEVIQYPDELLYAIKKITKKDVSVILAELLLLENPGQIRKIQTDYSLQKAMESEVFYVFITKDYEKEETTFLRDILVEKKVFEPDLPLFARFNLVGRQIYKEFLTRMPKSSEYNRLREHIANYFVLVHDDGGIILCHQNFIK